MDEEYVGFVWLGLLLIIIGFLLIVVPYLIKHMPIMEKIPPLLLYVYRRDGFYFATSPLLILLSIFSILIFMLNRYLR
ncbi:MAG: hypothetical protein QW390_00155 [Candidatus Bathyarchaeia archaeon]